MAKNIHEFQMGWNFTPTFRTGDELEPTKVTLVSGLSAGRPLDESFQASERNFKAVTPGDSKWPFWDG